MNPVQQVRDALLARAAELGVSGANEEATIDALLDRDVRPAVPTEADCRAYYDAHRDTLRPGSIAELDHILFAVTDPAPHPALREKAQAVLTALLADDRGFAEVAREISNCPSAEVGGNLGQITQGDVVPEFWRAISAFGRAGVLPQLVESRFGLHIVRVSRILPGEVLPYEFARAQIEEQLAERNLRVALHEYVHALVHPDCDGHDAADHDHAHHDHAHHGHMHHDGHVHHHHDPLHHAMTDTTSKLQPTDTADLGAKAADSHTDSSAEQRWATAVRRHDAQEAAQRATPPAPATRSQQTTGCGGGGGCACAGT
ncbi:MAG: peptidylprolyl isomerase [Burkholderiaceae bacterium]|jgi:peptidyl-prolyl cis-trans isomerase C|nr:peptidylprolyl isomerase [Burkholderiaceae bacterium]